MSLGTAYPQISRRTLLGLALASATTALAGCALHRPDSTASGTPERPALPSGWRLLGSSSARPGLVVDGTPVGGLSGLDYNPITGLWWALSDDRSQRAPARLYTFDLALNPHGVAAPQFRQMIALRQPDGRLYPGPSGWQGRARSGPIPDPEGLRLLPGTDLLVWTSEGDIDRGEPPALTLTRRDGRAVDELPLPAELVTMAQGVGPRNNQTLEGLALVPGTRQLWLGMEGALKQDGDLRRFTRYDLDGRRAIAQRAYALSEGPHGFGRAFIGVSELLAWGPHHLLVLERAFSITRGFEVRLVLADTRTGSDTLGQLRLDPRQIQPMRSTVLVDFGQITGAALPRIDNLEGMAWGPTLPTGERTLVLIADDNFLALQQTQCVALVLPAGDPA
ncbi:esterase-like activity of phytase family protein [Amphibiibacter pelophylacis]|uniref:Esterase-like activity of phytase family protein n=1 Tax=Amphibiibacter pelophylacis TaxID=1799477 RepID=A0ACC6NYJ0_9BURK